LGITVAVAACAQASERRQLQSSPTASGRDSDKYYRPDNNFTKFNVFLSPSSCVAKVPVGGKLEAEFVDDPIILSTLGATKFHDNDLLRELPAGVNEGTTLVIESKYGCTFRLL
jgi:hypothetical protein